MDNGFVAQTAAGCDKKRKSTASTQVITGFLFADKSISATTPTEATGISITLQPGTYAFQYFIRYANAATTRGIRFSVNFTGTVTAFVANLHFCDATATAATAAASQNAAGAAGQVFSVFAARAKSTAGWGTSISVDAVTDSFTRIDGVMVVAVAGDIELWHGSETAVATVLKAGTGLVIFKTA